MPGKKASKKKNNGEVKQTTQPKDTRLAPDQLLLNFLRQKDLVLIADEASLVLNVVPDTIYVVDKRPRIRVFYRDQFEKLKPQKTNGDEEKVEIVN